MTPREIQFQKTNWLGLLLANKAASYLAIVEDEEGKIKLASDLGCNPKTRRLYAKLLAVMARHHAGGAATEEAELVPVIEETFEAGLRNLGLDPAKACFVRSKAIGQWFAGVELGGEANRVIRHMANSGLLSKIDKRRPIWPTRPIPGQFRGRGFYWGEGAGDVAVIDLDKRGKPCVVPKMKTSKR